MLTPDELLSTTRAVRKRLDLTRPVERNLLEECFDLALQAPNGGNLQGWHFMVVADRKRKEAIGDLYRRSKVKNDPPTTPPEHRRMMDASAYLAQHLQDIPVLGSLAEETLRGLHVNKLFLGGNGLTVGHGLTTPDLSVATTDRALLRAAERVIITVDHSKIGRTALCQTAPTENINILVTDRGISGEHRRAFERAGIELLVV